MPRKRRYTPLHVYLNTRLVGLLEREYSGAVRFSYDADWLAWEHALPVSISMPLREDRFAGAAVMAVFDNLLPDHEFIRRRVAERVGADGIDAFSLLSIIGRDCIGALQFLAEGEAPQAADNLTGEPQSDEDIARILTSLDVTPLGIRSEHDFRISVAGAQEKTALLRHGEQWIEPTGTTPTTHILKPQIGRLANGMDLSHSVENEYLCLQIMEAFGLKVAETSIETFADQTALVIKRFDRHWTSKGQLIRLPQEDCCQALSCPPTRKYQNEGGPGIKEIMDVLQGSDDPINDRRDFFKSQILFWLIGATDGHAKNFSIALNTQGRFRMTPIYDVLTAQPSFDHKQLSHKDFKLAMRVGNSNQYNVEKIQGRHFLDSGLKSGLSRKVIRTLAEEVQDSALATLEALFNTLPHNFPGQLPESILAGVQRRLPRLSIPD